MPQEAACFRSLAKDPDNMHGLRIPEKRGARISLRINHPRTVNLSAERAWENIFVARATRNNPCRQAEAIDKTREESR